MKAKIFATAAIVMASLLAIASLTTFTPEQGVNAQKSMMGNYGEEEGKYDLRSPTEDGYDQWIN
jgi:hypothetical protein